MSMEFDSVFSVFQYFSLGDSLSMRQFTYGISSEFDPEFDLGF